MSPRGYSRSQQSELLVREAEIVRLRQELAKAEAEIAALRQELMETTREDITPEELRGILERLQARWAARFIGR